MQNPKGGVKKEKSFFFPFAPRCLGTPKNPAKKNLVLKKAPKGGGGAGKKSFNEAKLFF